MDSKETVVASDIPSITFDEAQLYLRTAIHSNDVITRLEARSHLEYVVESRYKQLIGRKPTFRGTQVDLYEIFQLAMAARSVVTRRDLARIADTDELWDEIVDTLGIAHQHNARYQYKTIYSKYLRWIVDPSPDMVEQWPASTSAKPETNANIGSSTLTSLGSLSGDLTSLGSLSRDMTTSSIPQKHTLRKDIQKGLPKTTLVPQNHLKQHTSRKEIDENSCSRIYCPDIEAELETRCVHFQTWYSRACTIQQIEQKIVPFEVLRGTFLVLHNDKMQFAGAFGANINPVQMTKIERVAFPQCTPEAVLARSNYEYLLPRYRKKFDVQNISKGKPGRPEKSPSRQKLQTEKHQHDNNNKHTVPIVTNVNSPSTVKSASKYSLNAGNVSPSSVNTTSSTQVVPTAKTADSTPNNTRLNNVSERRRPKRSSAVIAEQLYGLERWVTENTSSDEDVDTEMDEQFTLTSVKNIRSNKRRKKNSGPNITESKRGRKAARTLKSSAKSTKADIDVNAPVSTSAPQTKPSDDTPISTKSLQETNQSKADSVDFQVPPEIKRSETVSMNMEGLPTANKATTTSMSAQHLPAAANKPDTTSMSVQGLPATANKTVTTSMNVQGVLSTANKPDTRSGPDEGDTVRVSSEQMQINSTASTSKPISSTTMENLLVTHSLQSPTNTPATTMSIEDSNGEQTSSSASDTTMYASMPIKDPVDLKPDSVEIATASATPLMSHSHVSSIKSLPTHGNNQISTGSNRISYGISNASSSDSMKDPVPNNLIEFETKQHAHEDTEISNFEELFKSNSIGLLSETQTSLVSSVTDTPDTQIASESLSTSIGHTTPIIHTSSQSGVQMTTHITSSDYTPGPNDHSLHDSLVQSEQTDKGDENLNELLHTQSQHQNIKDGVLDENDWNTRIHETGYNSSNRFASNASVDPCAMNTTVYTSNSNASAVESSYRFVQEIESPIQPAPYDTLSKSSKKCLEEACSKAEAMFAPLELIIPLRVDGAPIRQVWDGAGVDATQFYLDVRNHILLRWIQCPHKWLSPEDVCIGLPRKLAGFIVRVWEFLDDNALINHGAIALTTPFDVRKALTSTSGSINQTVTHTGSTKDKIQQSMKSGGMDSHPSMEEVTLVHHTSPDTSNTTTIPVTSTMAMQNPDLSFSTCSDLVPTNISTETRMSSRTQVTAQTAVSAATMAISTCADHRQENVCSDVSMNSTHRSSHQQNGPISSTSFDTSRVSKEKHVLVVGAGMAGLSAARQLARWGYNVTVLEARDRLGGRIHTLYDTFQCGVDEGAMVTTGDEPNPCAFIARQANIPLHTVSDEQCRLFLPLKCVPSVASIPQNGFEEKVYGSVTEVVRFYYSRRRIIQFLMGQGENESDAKTKVDNTITIPWIQSNSTSHKENDVLPHPLFGPNANTQKLSAQLLDRNTSPKHKVPFTKPIAMNQAALKASTKLKSTNVTSVPVKSTGHPTNHTTSCNANARAKSLRKDHLLQRVESIVRQIEQRKLVVLQHFQALKRVQTSLHHYRHIIKTSQSIDVGESFAKGSKETSVKHQLMGTNSFSSTQQDISKRLAFIDKADRAVGEELTEILSYLRTPDPVLVVQASAHELMDVSEHDSQRYSIPGVVVPQSMDKYVENTFNEMIEAAHSIRKTYVAGGVLVPTENETTPEKKTGHDTMETFDFLQKLPEEIRTLPLFARHFISQTLDTSIYKSPRHTLLFQFHFNQSYGNFWNGPKDCLKQLKYTQEKSYSKIVDASQFLRAYGLVHNGLSRAKWDTSLGTAMECISQTQRYAILRHIHRQMKKTRNASNVKTNRNVHMTQDTTAPQTNSSTFGGSVSTVSTPSSTLTDTTSLPNAQVIQSNEMESLQHEFEQILPLCLGSFGLAPNLAPWNHHAASMSGGFADSLKAFQKRSKSATRTRETAIDTISIVPAVTKNTTGLSSTSHVSCDVSCSVSSMSTSSVMPAVSSMDSNFSTPYTIPSSVSTCSVPCSVSVSSCSTSSSLGTQSIGTLNKSTISQEINGLDGVMLKLFDCDYGPNSSNPYANTPTELTKDDIVSALLLWHVANLEYGCAAPLWAVSLHKWDQDDEENIHNHGSSTLSKNGYSSFVHAMTGQCTIQRGDTQQIDSESAGNVTASTEKEFDIARDTNTVESDKHDIVSPQIYLNSAVNQIQYRTVDNVSENDSYGSVKIKCDDGREFMGDAAIVTIPLGCLQAQDIVFDPPLPVWKQQAIANLGNGLLNKVIFRFPYAFWRRAKCNISNTDKQQWQSKRETGTNPSSIATSSNFQTSSESSNSNMPIKQDPREINSVYHPDTRIHKACALICLGYSLHQSLQALQDCHDELIHAKECLARGEYDVSSIKKPSLTSLTNISTAEEGQYVQEDVFGRLVVGSIARRGECYMSWCMDGPTGAPCLVLMMAGESAAWVETTSNKIVVSRALAALKQIFGDDTVPKPTMQYVSRWGSDTFARGAYSYIPVGSTGTEYDTLAQSIGLHDCLRFAGEATNKQHPTTVSGAYESGIREAVALRTYFKLSQQSHIKQYIVSPSHVRVLGEKANHFREKAHQSRKYTSNANTAEEHAHKANMLFQLAEPGSNESLKNPDKYVSPILCGYY